MSSPRQALVEALLGLFQDVAPDRRALVALDGFDGVGKSHLAAELVAASTGRHRPMVAVGIDGFHHPKATRLKAGNGPDGFYHGSYRYDAFLQSVVEPLRRREPITPAVWDASRDQPVTAAPVVIPEGGLVLVEGIFLQRPELVEVWDATVWLDAPFQVTVPRGNARFGLDPDPAAPSNQRYVGGQQLYLAQADPRRRSTWIVDNTDLERPRLLTDRHTSG